MLECTPAINGILKAGISDIFPIFNISMKHRLDSSDRKVTIRKRIINADSILEFRDILSEVDWGNLYSISNPKDAYEYFLKVFSGICNLAFILKTNSVKRKTAKFFDDRPFENESKNYPKNLWKEESTK